MENKPDFSNTAYLLPRINKEGKRFGLIAVGIAFALTILSSALQSAILCSLVLPLWLLAYGVPVLPRPGTLSAHRRFQGDPLARGRENLPHTGGSAP